MEVRLDLGGSSRLLNARFGAWAAVEEHGYRWLTLLPQIQGPVDQISFRALQEIVWALLWKEQPRPSLEEVGEWLGGDTFGPTLRAVAQAITASFPPAEGDRGSRPTMGGPGIGTAPSTSPSAPASDSTSSGSSPLGSS